MVIAAPTVTKTVGGDYEIGCAHSAKSSFWILAISLTPHPFHGYPSPGVFAAIGDRDILTVQHFRA